MQFFAFIGFHCNFFFYNGYNCYICRYFAMIIRNILIYIDWIFSEMLHDK